MNYYVEWDEKYYNGIKELLRDRLYEQRSFNIAIEKLKDNNASFSQLETCARYSSILRRQIRALENELKELEKSKNANFTCVNVEKKELPAKKKCFIKTIDNFNGE